jgi:hypothetical protein
LVAYLFNDIGSGRKTASFYGVYASRIIANSTGKFIKAQNGKSSAQCAWFTVFYFAVIPVNH